MSDNQLSQGWDEMMHPMNFDELDFDGSWMAGGSLLSAQHTQPIASSNGASFDVNGNGVPIHKPFLCAQCPAAYRRLGDLSRHQKEKHSAASSKYLCPIEKCPRGIEGEGFGRNCHLVNHLTSGKHGMDAREAKHLARQHNKPKAKATLRTGNLTEGGVNSL